MDIPLNADVSCADGPGGRSTTIILNPITSEITHVVVKEGRDEYMVPLDFITESTAALIQLRCTCEELRRMDLFVKMQFMGTDNTSPEFELRMDAAESDANWWPYTQIDDQYMDIYDNVEQIPHHELAIHRGAEVRANDGHIGQVDEFIVNPTNNHISHLVLKERHLFGSREVTVAIDQIERIEQDIVYLKLDKKGVRALPDVPLSRRYWK
jgi:sporulation protein YlmC with PRC-barrel domain